MYKIFVKQHCFGISLIVTESNLKVTITVRYLCNYQYSTFERDVKVTYTYFERESIRLDINEYELIVRIKGLYRVRVTSRMRCE